MQEQMQARLAELRQEYQKGHAQLQELVKQESFLRETLLRISGAIQVIEEMLAQGQENLKSQEAPSGPMRVP
jgi:septation ring formation regulator EzrA